MSEIQDIFKVPVYKTLLDIDNTKLENYAMSQYRKSKGRYISNVGGWQSDEYFESDNIKPINELISSIQKELPLFTEGGKGRYNNTLKEAKEYCQNQNMRVCSLNELNAYANMGISSCA